MKALLAFACAALLAGAGCASQHKTQRVTIEDIPRAEGAVSALQDEIAILQRAVIHYRKDYRIAPEEQESHAAAARASAHYSDAERARDLQTLIQILERRKGALSAELKALQPRYNF